MIEFLLFLILLAVLYGRKDTASKGPYTGPWDQTTATRDLIVALTYFAICLAPFAVIWWVVVSAAMAARH